MPFWDGNVLRRGCEALPDILDQLKSLVWGKPKNLIQDWACAHVANCEGLRGLARRRASFQDNAPSGYQYPPCIDVGSEKGERMGSPGEV